MSCYTTSASTVPKQALSRTGACTLGLAVASLIILALSSGFVEAQEAQPGAFVLEPGFTVETEGYASPYAGHNGKHVLFSKGQQIIGVDPKTSLVRWQEGELKKVRSITDMGDRLLMIGEHIAMLDKQRGKRLWDFPLNCFGPGQCNADLLASTEDKLLVGGFGQVYNMIQLINKSDGKEVWPSWVTTCGIQGAGIVGESVVLVCSSDNPLVQRIEFKSRRTMFTAPAPVRFFKADDAWFSESYIYVTGKIAGKRKLYVFSTEDGKLAGKFGVKEGVGQTELGFLISTTAARFVPWQLKDGHLTLWGIDVKTKKSAWKSSHDSAEIIGQHESLLSLLEVEDERWVATGLSLADGSVAFRFPLPMDEPRALLLGKMQFIWSPSSTRFLVVDVQAGKVRYLGAFNSPSGALPDQAYFARVADRFVTLLDNTVTVYSASAVQSSVDKLVELLDGGNGVGALEAYQGLAPFRTTLPEAAEAYRQITRFRWLNAQMKLRQGDFAEAADTVATILEEKTTWDQKAFETQFQRLAGHALQLGFLSAGSSRVDDHLVAILEFIVERSPSASNAQVTLFAEVAISLADALVGTAHEYTASELVATLQEANKFTAIIQGSPFWTRFRVEEVGTGLELANQAFQEGDFQVAADLLRELSASPIAAQLFGTNFDPWLDAAGLYLLPADLQGMKLPGVMKGLNKRFASGKKKLLQTTRKSICLRSCDFTERFCPQNCVSVEACAKSASVCRRACNKGKRQWKVPAFSVPATSTRFFKCR